MEALSSLPYLASLDLGFYPVSSRVVNLHLDTITHLGHIHKLTIRVHMLHPSLFFSGETVLTHTTNDFIPQAASLISKCPNLEHLSIQLYAPRVNPMAFQGDTLLHDLLAQCPPDNPLPLKTLDLHNVLFVLNPDHAEMTMVHLRSLKSLQYYFSEFTQMQRGDWVYPFPIIDPETAQTPLRTLTIESPMDYEVYRLIPRLGLSHLSLIDIARTGEPEDASRPLSRNVFFRDVLPRHADTLESLAIIPRVPLPEWCWDEEMGEYIDANTYRALKHLAVGVSINADWRIEENVIVCLFCSSICHPYLDPTGGSVLSLHLYDALSHCLSY